MCSAKSYDGKDIHKKNMKSAQYNFECCRSNMCNENVTFSVSELPPIPSKSINLKSINVLTKKYNPRAGLNFFSHLGEIGTKILPRLFR